MSAVEKPRATSARRSSSRRAAAGPSCLLCDKPADQEWSHIPVCSDHYTRIFEEARTAGIRGDRPLYRKLAKLYNDQSRAR